jgi:hypothetical protein
MNYYNRILKIRGGGELAPAPSQRLLITDYASAAASAHAIASSSSH